VKILSYLLKSSTEFFGAKKMRVPKRTITAILTFAISCGAIPALAIQTGGGRYLNYWKTGSNAVNSGQLLTIDLSKIQGKNATALKDFCEQARKQDRELDIDNWDRIFPIPDQTPHPLAGLFVRCKGYSGGDIKSVASKDPKKLKLPDAPQVTDATPNLSVLWEMLKVFGGVGKAGEVLKTLDIMH
jgi:hypothetical protein